MELYGVVTKVETGSNSGYYQVVSNIRPNDTLRGVSIRGTALTLGQRVNVVQCLNIGSGDEYGFFAEGDEYGVVQVDYGSIDAIKNLAPHGYLLASIARKAGNMLSIYGTGTIASLVKSGSTVVGAFVDLVLSGTRTALGFSSAVDASKFKVGDGVLVSYYIDQPRVIEGWWDTVNGDYPIPPTGTLPRWRFHFDSGVWKIAKSYLLSGALTDVFSKELTGIPGTDSAGYSARLTSDSDDLYCTWDNGSDNMSFHYNISTEAYDVHNVDQPDQGGHALNLSSIAGSKILYLSTVGAYISDYDGTGLTDITSMVTAAGGAFSGWLYALNYANGTYYLTGYPAYAGTNKAIVVDISTGAYTQHDAYVNLGFVDSMASVIWHDETNGKTYIYNRAVPGYSLWLAELSGTTISNETDVSGTPYKPIAYGNGVSQNGLFYDGARYAYHLHNSTRNVDFNQGTFTAQWLVKEYDY